MQDLAQRPKRPTSQSIFKDRKIEMLHRSLVDARKQSAVLQRKVGALESVLARQDVVVLKKLRTLGWEEFERVHRRLRIQAGDNLYVEDCDVHSTQVVEALRGVVGVVVAGKPVSRALERELPFIVVSASTLPLEHLDRFVVVPKASLQRAIAGKQVLSRVIEEYKRERARE
jgi:predicted RNase H-like nuclease (RuvC/YqgF family)